MSGSRTPQERATTCTVQRQKLDALSCASADKLAFIRGSSHRIRAARAPSPAGCKPLPAGAACSSLGKEWQELLAKRTPVPSFFTIVRSYYHPRFITVSIGPTGNPQGTEAHDAAAACSAALAPSVPSQVQNEETRAVLEEFSALVSFRPGGFGLDSLY